MVPLLHISPAHDCPENVFNYFVQSSLICSCLETPEVHPQKGIKPVPSGTKRLPNLPSVTQPLPAEHKAQGSSRNCLSQTLLLPQSNLASHNRKVRSDVICTLHASTLASSDSVNIPMFKVYPRGNSSPFLCPPPLCHITVFTNDEYC